VGGDRRSHDPRSQYGDFLDFSFHASSDLKGQKSDFPGIFIFPDHSIDEVF
jgi:hypothetical protein